MYGAKVLPPCAHQSKFEKYFFFIQSFRMFWNIVFFNMESSKWSNYSRRKCWTSHGAKIFLLIFLPECNQKNAIYPPPPSSLASRNLWDKIKEPPHMGSFPVWRIVEFSYDSRIFCPRVSNMHNTTRNVHIWLSKKITPMTTAICTTLLGSYLNFYFF